MLALEKLRVSLTKHGAHKLALLLARYDAQEVLRHLNGSIPGVNIDSVQALKNLSASGTGSVPHVWNKARAAGRDSINGLVLIAIIFSHGNLIKAMRVARTAPMRGIIKKGAVLDDKAFTNFAHTLEELGYSTSHTANQVTYKLNKLFEVPGLHHLAAELLALKLRDAGWSRLTSLEEEMTNHDLNEVFSISKEQLRSWLATGSIEHLDNALRLKSPPSIVGTAGTAGKLRDTPMKTEPPPPPPQTRADVTDSLMNAENAADWEGDIPREGIDNDEHRLRAIKTRRGQHRFRQRLLSAYSRKCAVTYCGVEALLEAAHITPHAELTDYNVSNGLLLRADIHTLFDLDLLTIDESYTVRVSEVLRSSEYWDLNNRQLASLPENVNERPNRAALQNRRKNLKAFTL